jgi:hypothetical protein
LKKFGTIFGLFAVSFLMGFGILVRTSQWNSMNRDPAAIHNVSDFSTLSGLDLTHAMKKRLLAGAAVVRSDQGLGVELGHFAMQGFTGAKSLACQEYHTITLGFSAEGMASSGEKPLMEVEGVCEFSSDMTKIDPILIPVEKILHEPAVDGELQFREGRRVTLRFKGMTDEWPRQWQLISVKLSNSNGLQDVLIEGDEFKAMLGRPMVVNF